MALPSVPMTSGAYALRPGSHRGTHAVGREQLPDSIGLTPLELRANVVCLNDDQIGAHRQVVISSHYLLPITFVNLGYVLANQ